MHTTQLQNFLLKSYRKKFCNRHLAIAFQEIIEPPRKVVYRRVFYSKICTTHARIVSGISDNLFFHRLYRVAEIHQNVFFTTTYPHPQHLTFLCVFSAWHIISLFFWHIHQLMMKAPDNLFLVSMMLHEFILGYLYLKLHVYHISCLNRAWKTP